MSNDDEDDNGYPAQAGNVGVVDSGQWTRLIIHTLLCDCSSPILERR
jgi:hypothetical protein